MSTASNGPGAVELLLDNGTRCMGEQISVEGALAVCLLLHDRHGDIDQMRGLADAVRRYSMSVLLIDLPGHGLSDGDVEVDAMAALQMAMSYSAELATPLCVIAEGSSADLLLRSLPTVSVAGYALLSPRSDFSEVEFDASPWSRTASISILDPHDQRADAVASLIARRTHAVAGRVYAHKSATLGTGRASWPLQAAQSSAQFLAERAAFAGAAAARDEKEGTR